MYAVNPEAMCVRPILEASKLLAEEGVCEKLRGRLYSPHNKSRLPALGASPRGEFVGADSVPDRDARREIYAANILVPVVKQVLEFARQRLWMPEVCRRSFLSVLLHCVGDFVGNSLST